MILQSAGDATIYKQPNFQKYDFPPIKRAHTAQAMAAMHMALDSSLSAPGPSCPTHINNAHSHATPLSAPVPTAPTRRTPARRHISRVLVIHDCAIKKRNPTVEELLQLMDTYNPAVGLDYLSLFNDFKELDLDDVVDVSALPVEFLAAIGNIGLDAARRLHTYCRDKLLDPLRFLRSNRTDTDDGTTASDSDMGGDKKQRVLRWVNACAEVKEAEERTETIVVTDDEEEDSDVATVVSCEV
jgi:hypothetical protein